MSAYSRNFPHLLTQFREDETFHKNYRSLYSTKTLIWGEFLLIHVSVKREITHALKIDLKDVLNCS